MNTWQEDARFVGAFIRGGSWEVGLRIARRVQPNTGTGAAGHKSSGNNLPLGRISLRDFAIEAGVSHPTISAYLKTWELAADEGLVDHAADLNPDDEYDWAINEFTNDDWHVYYSLAVSEPRKKKPKAVKPKEKSHVPKHHDKHKEVVALHNRGLTYKETAEAAGVGERQVRHIVEREHIEQEVKNDAVIIDWDSLPANMSHRLETMKRQVRRELEAEFEPRVQAEVQTRLGLEFKRTRQLQTESRRILEARKGIFTRGDYDLIRSCLHPDSRSSASDQKLATAFRLFNEAEILFLNEQDRPTTLPSSLEDLLKRRKA